MTDLSTHDTSKQRHYEFDIELLGFLFGTREVIKGVANGTIYREDGRDVIVRERISTRAWDTLIVNDAIGVELQPRIETEISE